MKADSVCYRFECHEPGIDIAASSERSEAASWGVTPPTAAGAGEHRVFQPPMVMP